MCWVNTQWGFRDCGIKLIREIKEEFFSPCSYNLNCELCTDTVCKENSINILEENIIQQLLCYDMLHFNFLKSFQLHWLELGKVGYLLVQEAYVLKISTIQLIKGNSRHVKNIVIYAKLLRLWWAELFWGWFNINSVFQHKAQ